jgi:peptide/nickel transport system ATP-binding protein/peptide/nickel transport system permease protein
MRTSRWGRSLRTPLGACAAALLAVMALIAILAPVLWTGTANAFDTSAILRGPSPAHWAGTNNLGQDVFYQVLVATRLTAALALAATAIGVGTGLLLGTAPLVLGRRAGRVITAVVNIAVAFPALLLALFFAVIFGVGARGALLAIGFASAPTFARLTRTLSASVAGLDYIAAARIAGVGRMRLLTRHVLPNIGETLIVNATIAAGDALLAFAGLSFLGLGVQAPSYDWGKLLYDGLNGIYVHPVAALAPGIAVILAGLAFNLFGEAMARALGVPELAGGAIVRAARAGRGTRRPGTAASPGSAPSTTLPSTTLPSTTLPSTTLPSTAPPFSPTEPDDCVLSVRDLRVSFPGGVHPVRGVSLTLRRGEAVGVVGESGSGKSLTALAIARLLEPPAAITADQVRLLGHDLLLSPGDGVERHFLGTSLGMVFQDPMTSFNPVRHVGGQLAEVATQHQGMTRRQAAARAVDRLRAVRIPSPERRYRQFPHELSGGMRQRAMIGMAVMGSPALVIADEPTTALDVTVQREVLRLLKSQQAAEDLALLFISHDITVVGQVCDRVLVMYAGRIVESLPSAALAASARHPYTRALLAAVPSMETDREQPLAVVPGRPADPADVRPGCAFAPRCAFADDQCRAADPVLTSAGDGHQVACWHPQASPVPITLVSGAATPAATADARETT